MKILTLLALLFFVPSAWGALDQTSNDKTDDNVGSSTALTFSVAPTVGCAVFVVWNGYNASNYNATTVADDAAGSYTIIKGSAVGSIQSVPMLAYLQSVGSSMTTVTITHSNSSGNYVRARAFSWCGQAAAMYDQTGDQYEASATGITVTSGVTTANDELVIAVVQVSISSSLVHLSDPATTGYTTTFIEQDHALHVAGGSGYKVVASTGAQSATWTHDSGLSQAIIATFKLGAAPPASGRRRLQSQSLILQ